MIMYLQQLGNSQLFNVPMQMISFCKAEIDSAETLIEQKLWEKSIKYSDNAREISKLLLTNNYQSYEIYMLLTKTTLVQLEAFENLGKYQRSLDILQDSIGQMEKDKCIHFNRMINLCVNKNLHILYTKLDSLIHA